MQFIDPANDRWLPAQAGAPIVPAANRLLDLAQWQAARDDWPVGVPVGVTVPNDVDIETLEPDLGRIALFALAFPKWTDGRAYTQAHLLRARYRFGGEVRATGDVLVDMLPLLKRTGFDAVAMRADQSQAAAERVLGLIPAHYQGDVTHPQPLFAAAYA